MLKTLKNAFICKHQRCRFQHARMGFYSLLKLNFLLNLCNVTYYLEELEEHNIISTCK